MQVYFDNAATTPLATPVVDRMTELIQGTHGNPSSIHVAGRKARSVIEDARKRIAEHLRASQGEIFFTSCATESNNTAIIGAVRDLGVEHIITSPTEHPCVLNSVKYVSNNYKTKITYLDIDKQGNIDLEQLNQILEDTTDKTLVSIMHGNNEIGTMSDIEKIGTLCLNHKALFHCDTVQTVGKYDIDLSRLYISFLSGSGHKIYGPKGSGFLYVNNRNMIKPLIHGGGQERNMRSGTENLYGIGGLAAAMDFTVEHRTSHIEHILQLRNRLKEGISSRSLDIRYNGNQETNFLHHILSLNIPRDERAEMVMMNLDIYGICASAGSACSSGIENDSHVLSAINSPVDRKTIRISLSYKNTNEEIDYLLDKLGDIL